MSVVSMHTALPQPSRERCGRSRRGTCASAWVWIGMAVQWQVGGGVKSSQVKSSQVKSSQVSDLTCGGEDGGRTAGGVTGVVRSEGGGWSMERSEERGGRAGGQR